MTKKEIDVQKIEEIKQVLFDLEVKQQEELFERAIREAIKHPEKLQLYTPRGNRREEMKVVEDPKVLTEEEWRNKIITEDKNNFDVTFSELFNPSGKWLEVLEMIHEQWIGNIVEREKTVRCGTIYVEEENGNGKLTLRLRFPLKSEEKR